MRTLALLTFLNVPALAQVTRVISVTDAADPIPGRTIVRDITAAAQTPPTSSASTFSELPGWPAAITANVNFAPWRSGVVEDLDRDGANEILVASTDQRLYGFRLDGSAFPGFPINLIGMAQYAPSVADLEGDGDLEIVQFTRGLTSGGRFYIFDHTGAVLPGFPKSIANQNLEGSPTLADLDDDGTLEILVPERAAPIGRLHVFEKDGSQWGGNWPIALDHVPTGSPAVADVDHDGVLEIAYYSYTSAYLVHADGTALPGWPRSIAGANFSYQSPAFANLDADADLELVLGAHQTNAGYYAFNSDGSLLSGWPKLVGTWTYVPPVVADLENDGTLEIIGGREGTGVSPSAVVFAWTASGVLKPGFPFVSTNPGFAGGCGGAHSIADTNGDGLREILSDANVMNAAQGFLYGISSTGAPLPGFPLRPNGFTYMNAPVVSDVDGDGDVDLLYLSHNGTAVDVHLVDLQAPSSPANVPWGAYHQDIARQGEEGGGRKLSTRGDFAIGGSVEIRIVGTPGSIATVGLSTVTQHHDTAFGWYHLGPQRRIVNSVPIPSSGEYVRTFALPTNPVLAGTTLLFQGAAIQGGSGRVTNVLGRVLHP